MNSYNVKQIYINKIYSIHLINIKIELYLISIDDLIFQLKNKCDFNDIIYIYNFIECIRKNIDRPTLSQYNKIYIVKSKFNFLNITILDATPIIENIYLAMELNLPEKKITDRIYY